MGLSMADSDSKRRIAKYVVLDPPVEYHQTKGSLQGQKKAI